MLRRIVYLIGAGPGAPDLISVRGLRCLQAADVVIYDERVHKRLLDLARPDAEKLNVGSAAPQPIDQEAICYLIAEKAREHKLIARLKWGDSFLFDQGGVEALFLQEQHIPFEVVPGIPAAIAGSAHAGIPLTYPGSGDTLTLVRGSDGREPIRVDWAALARLDGAIASYSSGAQMVTMISELLAHGRSGDEPAAIIRHGTLLNQQVETGTLQELAQRFDTTAAPSPGLLVIGKVVGLRDRLRWFDERPLFGRRVLVTRSREQSGELVDLLEAHGAQAVEAPLITIVAPEDYGPLDEACERAGAYDWIVFTSANGAGAFMDRLLRGTRDVRALAGARLCAVGPGTASRLTRFGLNVDLIPEDHSADGVVAALKGTGSLKGKRVLFPKADIARDTLPEELRAVGAQVYEVIAYRTVTAESDAQLNIYRQLLDRRIDAVTFSSASAIRAFVTIHGADQAVDLLNHTVVATIGPVTSDAALRYGITPQVVPPSSTSGALVEALVQHFRSMGTGK